MLYKGISIVIVLAMISIGFVSANEITEDSIDLENEKPYTIFGTIFNDKSQFNVSIEIINLRTNDSLDAVIYDNLVYEGVLDDLEQNYAINDTIEIKATSGQLTKIETIVIEQMGADKRIDFNFKSNENVSDQLDDLYMFNNQPDFPSDFFNPIIIDKISTTTYNEPSDEPQIKATLVDVRAPPYYRLAFTDKLNNISLTLRNDDNATREIISINLTHVEPDGITEHFLTTVYFGMLQPGMEKTKDAFDEGEGWIPTQTGRNWIKGDIYIKGHGNDKILVDMFRESFNVVPGWRPVMDISGDWVIDTPTTIDNMTIVVEGDVYINADTVMSNGTLFAGNFSVTATYTIDVGFEVDLWCNYSGQYKVEVFPSGTLNVYGNITNNPDNYHYWFYMNGTLLVSKVAFPPTAEPGTIENTHGSPDLSQPGGIICTTDNVLIENGATIKNGKTHGIWLQNSDAVITDSMIHDNGGDGVVCIDSSTPLMESNTISWNGRYGINAKDSIPIIKNNNIIQFNEVGIGIENVYNENAIIEENMIKENMATGIYCTETNITIANNTIMSNGLTAKFYGDEEIGESNWTIHDGLWRRVSNESGNAPPWNISHSGDWAWWYGYEHSSPIVGDYDTTNRNFGNLTTVDISLVGSKSAYLVFWSWYETDTLGQSTDQRWVIVKNSTDESKIQIYGEAMETWYRYVINISEYSGSIINVTFNFDTIDDQNNIFQGWYIDDVEIIGTDPYLYANGIIISKSSHYIIYNNTISNHNAGGILNLDTDYSIIKNNTLTKNRYWGIILDSSNFNRITQNNITASGTGIVIYKSSNNTIENNAISSSVFINPWIISAGVSLVYSPKIINNRWKQPSIFSAGTTSYKDDTVLFKLDSTNTLTKKCDIINEISSIVGAKEIHEFPYSGIYKMKLNDIEIEEALGVLSRDSRIQYAEPDYLVTIDKTPNDAQYNELWGLNNIGQTGGTSNADIDAPEAWDYTTGSQSVVVAVIDTGIDYNHPDLNDNIWRNPGESIGDANGDGYPGIQGIDDDGDGLVDEDNQNRLPSDPDYDWGYADDDDENGYIDDIHGINAITGDGDPMDDHNHGTHVAGTIGAIGDNNIGVVGVNWDVNLMALKFLSFQGWGFTSDAIECVEYMLMMKDNGVNIKVSSNSWSGTEYSQALYDSIEMCRDSDILFVAASGNGGNDIDYTMNPAYPACYNLTNIISVAATDHNDKLASFSNYGINCIDVAAPGVNILSTLRGNSYGYYSGTSMATPHVSGLAALIAAINPSFNNISIKNLIMTTVDTIPDLTNKVVANGRINAYNALSFVPSGIEVLVHNPGNHSSLIKESQAEVIVSVSDGVHPVTNAYVNITFNIGDPSFSLWDDGTGIDQVAGDGYYSGLWVPQYQGIVVLKINVSVSNSLIIKEIVVTVVNGNIVQNNTLIDLTRGIYLGASNKNVVNNNEGYTTTKKMGMFIAVEFSRNNNIFNNKGSCSVGIGLNRGVENYVVNNFLNSTGQIGIVCHVSWENYIAHNSISTTKRKPLYPGHNPISVGIRVWTGIDNIISNNVVNSNNGYGIYLGAHWTSNNIIMNNTANSNNLSGIYLDYYSPDTYARNNSIVNNNVNNNNQSGIYCLYVKNSTIANNNVFSNKWDGISLSYSNYNIVSNNNASSNSWDGISVEGSDNNSILNNNVYSNYRGIMLLYSNNNSLMSNNVSKNSFGIILSNSDNNTIANNNASLNSRNGIVLHFSDYCNVTSNTASSNDEIYGFIYSGIRMWHASYNTVDKNNVNSQYYGIIAFYSNSNLISNNLVFENEYYGIQITHGSNENVIRNNTIMSNGDYGIYVVNSVNNAIYHNNIIDNVKQAHDDTFNQWDNGYPSGGNYWSDYTGVDFNSTPTQDVPPPDGIGDTPYTDQTGQGIQGTGSQDNYPLMHPSNYLYYEPIRINSDFEFATLAGTKGWQGDGSEGNPYIIEKFAIDGKGLGYCIFIGNTTDHFIIRNCFLYGVSGSFNVPFYGDIGLYLHNATNGTVVNNIVTLSDWLGIGLIESSKNNVVHGNTVTSNVEGIRLDWYSNNNTITKNIVSGNYWGIFNLGMSNDNIISDNTVCNGDVGISIAEWSTGNTVKNNLVYSNQHMGIALSVDAYDNVIEANTISLSQEGIHLNYSDDNEIIGNVVSDCSYYGIYFHHSNNNTIANNTISNNNYGMYATLLSNNNLIYHNNFLFNTNQAFDDCNNFWNASVPAEGNYWSDFITNPGFPTEYRIPGGGNIDYWPSANPWP